jgi:hypothetical protein
MTATSEDQGLAEYAAFLAEQPREHEASLSEPNVATAYWAARKAGWAPDVLAADCAAAFRRGGGIGLIVTRLRTMAESSPVKREDKKPGGPVSNDPLPECSNCGIPYSRWLVSRIDRPGQVCLGCGSALELKQMSTTRRDERGLGDGPRLPRHHVEARMALLRVLWNRRSGPEEGEREMRSLIAAQQAE